MRHPIQTGLILLLPCLALAAGTAHAAGARAGVHPTRGEMVLLRDVHARPAYRPMPPSMAIIVDPSPNRQLNAVLGTGELSDADFAALSGGAPPAGPPHSSTLAQRIESPLQSALGGRVNNTAGGTSTLGGTIAGPMGAVGNATRGISGHVQGALAQFPLGTKAGGP